MHPNLLWLFGVTVLLAGCVVSPIHEEDISSMSAPTIMETLGDSSVSTVEDGKLLASESITATHLPVATSATLSTPQLLDAALANDEISLGEYTLYLAYALYDYSALPVAYQSSNPWRGTLVVHFLQETVTSPEFCTFTPEIQAELSRLLADSVEFTTCP